MNKEINKMIDNLQFIAEEESASITLTQDGCKTILDYITNLQEEKIQLEGKIKQLEHNCKQASDSCRQHRLASKNHIRRLKRREQQINIYKSKNEKAIEYIMTELISEWNIENGGCVSGSDLPVDAITPLLNILQGEDKDE